MTAVNLIAQIPVNSELQIEQVAEVLRGYAKSVLAEPGNDRFELYVDRNRSSVVVVERYKSEDAFQAHLNTDENKRINARLGEILAGGGSSLQMLEPLD